jgi:hypothetical protein
MVVRHLTRHSSRRANARGSIQVLGRMIRPSSYIVAAFILFGCSVAPAIDTSNIIGVWSNGSIADGTYYEEQFLADGVFCSHRQYKMDRRLVVGRSLGKWEMSFGDVMTVEYVSSDDPNVRTPLNYAQLRTIATLTNKAYKWGIQFESPKVVPIHFLQRQGIAQFDCK